VCESDRAIASILQEKLEQQIDRLLHLVSLVPTNELEWRPAPTLLRVCDLIGHLLECLAGFCAVLYAANPDKLKHFVELKSKPVNHACSIGEANSRIDEYRKCIREGFDLLAGEDFNRVIPTLFAKDGEPLLGLLIGNFEHLINHKHQLFLYLRLLGVEVGTRDLYFIREE
jgi:hypothetical protein